MSTFAGQTPPQVLAGYARGIYAVDADGSDFRYVSGVRAWTPTSGNSGELVWSPDGSKLAFPGNPAGLDYLSLIVLDTVTGKVNSLDAPLSIYRLEWDGEDAILAYGERSSPWRNAEVRIPLDGSPSTELFSIPQGSGSLAWSPNRLCYAFTVVRAGFKEETDIFARDGTLLTSVSDAGSPIWSPEGSMLALECGNGGPFKACVWPVDGTEPLRQLGDGRPEDWSGKGDAIAVSVWKDGGPKSVLLSTRGDATPISVNGSSAVFSPDGIHVALNRDGNVFVDDLATDAEVQITDSLIPYMRQLTWSPDGSSLLFTYNPDDTDIYLANADGSDPHVIIAGHSPSWSPDGSRIEFGVGEAALGAWGSFYVTAVTDRSLVRVGDYAFDDIGNPCWGYTYDPWSPDGRYVAYDTESDPNVVGGTYLASPDGPAPGLRSKFGSGPNWSPDGTGVTFTGSSSSNPYDTCEVFTAAVPDGEPVPLAKGVRSAWSPRGDLIAFTVNNEVHVISPDGSNERALASGGASGAPLYVRWSPDGSMLAFALSTSTLAWSAYVVDVDNGKAPLYVGDGQVENWTPDGQKVVLSKFEDRHYVSYLANIDGSGEQKFVDGAGVDWSPDGTKILYSR